MQQVIMRAMARRLWVPVLVMGLLAAPLGGWAQDAAAGIFAGAKALYVAAEAKPEPERVEDYRSVRRLLDLIVKDHPTSDLAVAILLQDTIEGVDVAKVDAALADAPPTAATVQTQVVTPPPATPNTVPETTVIAPVVPLAVPARPEKEIIADVQSELNRLGCGAGGADGVAGKRTSAAFARFIDMSGQPLTAEDLVSEAALSALRDEVRPVCTARWAVAHAPAKLAGSWGYRADCKVLFRKVRITGSMSMRQTGPGQFAGQARNSLGERGPVYASVSGNRVRTRIDFPRAKISSALATSSRSMTLSGKDSNGCDIVAWKN